MLFVDPNETCMCHDETSERLPLCDQYTEIPPQAQAYTEAIFDGEGGTAGPSRPCARSLSDSILDAHVSSKTRTGSFGPVTHDPFSATAFTHRFIYCSWLYFLAGKERDLSDAIFRDESGHLDRLRQGDNTALQVLNGVDGPTLRDYETLISIRNYLRYYKYTLKNIAWSLGANDLASRNPAEGQQDQEPWDRLQEMVTNMLTEVAEHMEVFAQRATMEESFAARRQARSAGQLTIIATVAVPCAFVASIFSMGGGGPFAAGEPLFGVYWAISIPATLILLTWVLFATSPRLRRVLQQVEAQLWRPWRASWCFLRRDTFITTRSSDEEAVSF